MVKRLGFLGPQGTYCEEAAIAYDCGATLVPLRSIPAVVAAVDAREVDEGVVPIENSLEGAVTFTLDLLIHESSMFIRSEVLVPVQHRLIGKPGTRLEDIRVVYSHPQGLAQCRGFLEKNLPAAQQLSSLSTAGSLPPAIASAAVFFSHAIMSVLPFGNRSMSWWWMSSVLA